MVLVPEILKAVEEMGYSTPTAIQEQSIPLIQEGCDLLAGSQTRTGKTAGFAIPILQNLMQKTRNRKVRALILTPTRELALQVEENIRTLTKHLPLKSTAIFGGVNINCQIKILKSGIDTIREKYIHIYLRRLSDKFLVFTHAPFGPVHFVHLLREKNIHWMFFSFPQPFGNGHSLQTQKFMPSC